MNVIAYTGVILNERSRKKLFKSFNKFIPRSYKLISHHMTINLGGIDKQFEKYLGLPIKLKVEEFAIDERVAVVKVSGFNSDNIVPHITIAVNELNNGKPIDSNNIDEENWNSIKKPIYLVGKIKEIPFK